MTSEQLIKKERFTSIQEAQAGLSNILTTADKKGNFYRVLRNNKPLGVLIPNKVWDSILEDLEALNSPKFKQSVQKARASKKWIAADELKKELGIAI